MEDLCPLTPYSDIGSRLSHTETFSLLENERLRKFDRPQNFRISSQFSRSSETVSLECKNCYFLI